MLDIMYESPFPFDDDDNDKIEEAEMMEEVIEAPDPFHVVVTDVDMGNESIRSLVSMAKTANAAEKHEVPVLGNEVHSQHACVNENTGQMTQVADAHDGVIAKKGEDDHGNILPKRSRIQEALISVIPICSLYNPLTRSRM
ncbi:hypothetical protein K492DRAFT_172453 [Lichtheimia hyalospora FSU 10163]|nr:hypothetical protein K492DRAFT_172453 [Lichtheimia hyalospora FSU 10163]